MLIFEIGLKDVRRKLEEQHQAHAEELQEDKVQKPALITSREGIQELISKIVPSVFFHLTMLEKHHELTPKPIGGVPVTKMLADFNPEPDHAYIHSEAGGRYVSCKLPHDNGHLLTIFDSEDKNILTISSASAASERGGRIEFMSIYNKPIHRLSIYSPRYGNEFMAQESLA
jgi:hypothetical protein